AAIAGSGRGAGDRGAAPERFLRVGRERTKAHAGNGDRDLQADGLLGMARAQDHVGTATLAIAFEWIAADRSAEKQEIVEMRQLALRTEPADVIDTGRGRAMDFGDGVFVERR